MLRLQNCGVGSGFGRFFNYGVYVTPVHPLNAAHTPVKMRPHPIELWTQQDWNTLPQVASQISLGSYWSQLPIAFSIVSGAYNLQRDSYVRVESTSTPVWFGCGVDKAVMTTASIDTMVVGREFFQFSRCM
eukprot:scaffold457_cov22-Cyclotella_meneghiniana.AAC.1